MGPLLCQLYLLFSSFRIDCYYLIRIVLNYATTQGLHHMDGDNIRRGLNKNLGFALEDREENIRRVAGLGGKLFADSGSAALCAFVPPYKKDREMARRLHQEAGLSFL